MPRSGSLFITWQWAILLSITIVGRLAWSIIDTRNTKGSFGKGLVKPAFRRLNKSPTLAARMFAANAWKNDGVLGLQLDVREFVAIQHQLCYAMTNSESASSELETPRRNRWDWTV